MDYFNRDGVMIYHGDCREVLGTLLDESVHCCVTSPPYWGLRDYGVNGQVGLERTPEEYVATLTAIFAEVRRVLRDDGTLWLNLGTSYATSPKGNPESLSNGLTNQGRASRRANAMDRAINKVASCGDTSASRSPLLQRVPARMSPPLAVHTQGKESFFSACGRSACQGVGKCGMCWACLAIPSLNIKEKDEINIPHLVAMALQADGWVLRQTIVWHKPAPMPESVRDRCTKAHESIFLLSKSQRYYFDGDAIAEDCTTDDGLGSRGVNGGACFGKQRHSSEGTGAQSREYDRPVYHKRNKRSVWTVNTAPYQGAHFATFPPKLIEPCILAGCPEGGTVLDPFLGSGTTAAVAQRLGRRCVGIELNKDYWGMAVDRFRQRVLFPAENPRTSSNGG